MHRRFPRAMTPKFELGRDFCTMHLPPSFIILCLLVRKLSCWQTNKQAHKQMPAKTSNVLCYATTLGKQTRYCGCTVLPCNWQSEHCSLTTDTWPTCSTVTLLTATPAIKPCHLLPASWLRCTTWLASFSHIVSITGYSILMHTDDDGPQLSTLVGLTVTDDEYHS